MKSTTKTNKRKLWHYTEKHQVQLPLVENAVALDRVVEVDVVRSACQLWTRVKKDQQKNIEGKADDGQSKKFFKVWD